MSSPNVNKSRKDAESPCPPRDAKMDAIACGVQARLEERTGYSRRITDETVNIARALGVADGEIVKWVSQRSRQLARDAERLKSIKTRLERIGEESYS